ncbi:probable C-mannosyltransferase DPY19L3 isoform X2 [Pomacea canaliculata]|nr:probable C-mannosyltransferase DPY19L3 isoform X2 [Pomacea canaliculata]
MNVYQEVVLAALYRTLPIKEDAILFYIKAIFALHGLLVAALFVMTWLMSRSWFAGILTAAFYSLNRLDTTRVSSVIPLRESFALPFLWVQVAALTYYFKPQASGWPLRISVGIIGGSTFLFCLCWQFNQFILLLQALALVAAFLTHLLPQHKVMMVLGIQMVSLLAVCLLQFVNTMILGSLALSFIVASFIIILRKGPKQPSGHWLWQGVVTVVNGVLILLLMLLINTAIKYMIQVEADEHIFKFLQNKFGFGNARDFDSRLYLCLGIFGFLTPDVLERLTKGLVFIFYLEAHVGLLLLTFIAILQKWNHSARRVSFSAGDSGPTANTNNTPSTRPTTRVLEDRPELAFHALQCLLFGGLAVTMLRMKYLWTPYMCVLGSLVVADSSLWMAILKLFKKDSYFLVEVIRHVAVVTVLAVLLAMTLGPVMRELEELREFWDPDTVDLMKWIKSSTPLTASFTGSMQLMAGVKLCTDRPITNHPHYEDKALRNKTKQLYQIYGRRTPEDVHSILKRFNSSYIILEDSICLARPKDNCRTTDIVDLDNGIVPDDSKEEEGLVRSTVPRFCDQVRHLDATYARYFKQVFVNKTFRVYQVL